MEKTYVVMISPDSPVTPSDASKRVLMMKLDLSVKETCFGLIIEGEEDLLNEAVEELKRIDRYGIYVKERGFKIYDNRICRLVRKKRRPGFHQFEREYATLPYIRYGLSAYEKGMEMPEKTKPRKIPAQKLKKLIKEMTYEGDGVSPN